MTFNEDSRVKIPAILHLVKLGYEYISKKTNHWDISTNIFTEIFRRSIKKLNPDLNEKDIKNLYDEIALLLTYSDLGKSFYDRIKNKSKIKLIDFDNIENNTFNVVTELPYKQDDEEFRPDISILINGMPLAFIEVKKPNNHEGILAEHKRIESRFKNKKFQKFINITQLILFSNNMEYDDNSHLPIQGAFYSTTSYDKIKFNYFREEETFNLSETLTNYSEEIEDFILLDNNLAGIKHSPEFEINKKTNTPTNRVCTSLFQIERFFFLLKYGIVYLKKENELQKHIMRYPQLFATKLISKKIEEGSNKGVIWHTQGSGKTALAYFAMKHLRDYFNKKSIIPKFYFIVDRIDLLEQALDEFEARGLSVHTIDTKEDFSKEIKTNIAIHNESGKEEITVVNIHKFKDDPAIIKNDDYNIKIQRIYFLDEVHRSYKPTGKFLVNLQESDKEAVKIGLTGTPLLGKKFNTKTLFGNYIHRYFYNLSIKDGYTLRLIREEIETLYKLSLEKTLKEIKILKGDLDRKELYSHPKFVEPMLDYIVDDMQKTRIALNDVSIGGMVICDSYQQAEKMHEIFNSKYYCDENKTSKNDVNNSFNSLLNRKNKIKLSGLILHDQGTKKDRKAIIKKFKKGTVDILFVYNMLLTGFDAPRLKKIYLGRKIESHNLLQALTRVNRSYKDLRYGYIVDFADIEKEFDKTNRAYLDELQSELGDEIINYENLFKNDHEINNDINSINKFLFEYDTKNLEIFSQQINQINDRKKILEIVKILNDARELHNIIKLQGKTEILEKLDFKNINKLYREASNRLNLINAKESIENNIDTSSLLNIALEDIIFSFSKINEEEMVLADQLKNILQKTRDSMINNFDTTDPEFVSLKNELERLFKKKNLNEVSKVEMNKNITELTKIYEHSIELDRKNNLLKAKYENDEKYVRLHKRLMETGSLTNNQNKLFKALHNLKKEIDSKIIQNENILQNESFLERMISQIIINEFKDNSDLEINIDKTNLVNKIIRNEYINEFNGINI